MPKVSKNISLETYKLNTGETAYEIGVPDQFVCEENGWTYMNFKSESLEDLIAALLDLQVEMKN